MASTERPFRCGDDWTKFGGWGIKRSGDGTWAYVLNASGDVVELSFSDTDGTARTALFSASNPTAVVAAIERARILSSRARVVKGDAQPTPASPVAEEALRAAEEQVAAEPENPASGATDQRSR